MLQSENTTQTGFNVYLSIFAKVILIFNDFIWALPTRGRAFTTQSLLRRGFQTCRSIPNANRPLKIVLTSAQYLFANNNTFKAF